MEREIQAVDGVTSLVSYHSILGSGIPDFFVPEEVRSMLKTGGWQMMMVNSEYTTATDEVAQQLEVPILARLPMDPTVAAAFDAGKMESLETNYLADVAEKLDV